ncbi:hypothetical protein LOTGIDRAFT_172347 [Lottia gigantea]|uniref:Fibrinogen C-terminal domain-containing protein n=1 Tax=Lottia gigantea TaxID=225164 RepID=V4B3F9_LOTGI|nr:hypothetical protein LOTGIDRAFT_172347 [Lottia gigantea]ESP01881.1 hypothetical protein LOTGIDRAFT_172347 [Lottia gigantea]
MVILANLQVYILIFPFQVLCFEIQAGSYIQTSMFYEPSTCHQSAFNNFLLSIQEVSVKKCSLRCSVTLNCRRFMFDVKTKNCFLYESGENCFSDGNIGDKRCYRQRWLCTEVNCVRCPIGYYGDACQHIIQDCSDQNLTLSTASSFIKSYIRPASNGVILEAKCVYKPGIFQATLIQSRDNNCSEVSFTKTWDEYANGFGYIHSEYWLGLNHVYNILQNHPSFQFYYRMTSLTETKTGIHHNFSISNAANSFRVISAFDLSQNPRPIVNRLFSTYDADSTNNNCPNRFKGGWWFADGPNCNLANPNGKRNDSVFEANIHWLVQFQQTDKIIQCIVVALHIIYTPDVPPTYHICQVVNYNGRNDDGQVCPG